MKQEQLLTQPQVAAHMRSGLALIEMMYPRSVKVDLACPFLDDESGILHAGPLGLVFISELEGDLPFIQEIFEGECRLTRITQLDDRHGAILFGKAIADLLNCDIDTIVCVMNAQFRGMSMGRIIRELDLGHIREFQMEFAPVLR